MFRGIYNVFYFVIFAFCISVVASHGSRSPGNRYDARHEAWKCLNASNDYAQIRLDMFLCVNNIHIERWEQSRSNLSIWLLYNSYDNDTTIFLKRSIRESDRFGNRKCYFFSYLFIYLREFFRYKGYKRDV